jgi:putative spermidine/putrescine transport system permease protein
MTSARTWFSDKPGLAGFALFLAVAVVPVAVSLIYALLYTFGLTGLLSDGFTLAHWSAVLGSEELWTSLALSAAVALAACVLAATGGLAVALGLRPQLARGPLSYAIYLPLAMPFVVGAFVGFETLSAGGMLSRVAYRLGLTAGIDGFPSLTNDTLSLGVIATHAFLALPFLAVVFVQLYESESIDAYAALSRSLGATARQTLRRVTLPMLVRRARPNLVLLFIVLLGSYEIPLLLGRQSPQMISVLTVRKYQRFDLLQKPDAFVIAIVYTATVLLLLLTAFRPRTSEERA